MLWCKRLYSLRVGVRMCLLDRMLFKLKPLEGAKVLTICERWRAEDQLISSLQGYNHGFYYLLECLHLLIYFS